MVLPIAFIFIFFLLLLIYVIYKVVVKKRPERMKFCPGCGAEITSSDRFCPSCGEKTI